MAKRSTRAAAEKAPEPSEANNAEDKPDLKIADSGSEILIDETCKRIITKFTERAEKLAQVKEQTDARDAHRHERNGDEEQIEEIFGLIKVEKRKSTTQVEGQRLCGLYESRRRHIEKYNEHSVKLRELNASINSTMDEVARLIAHDDPSGTLFEKWGLKDE